LQGRRSPSIWRAWLPLWRRRELLAGTFLHLGGLLAIALVNGGGYLVVVHVSGWRGVTTWDPALPLDAAIPALPWTIAVYVTMYAYFPLPLLAAPRGDRGRAQLVLAAQALAIVAWISFAVFLLLPAEIHLREEMRALLSAETGWVRALFRWLYAIDEPWNAWPSLHVSQTLLIVLCVQRWSGGVAGRRAWLPAGRARAVALALLWTAWSALALSTLTTRQHFLVDPATGALLGAATWRAYLRPALERAETKGPCG